MYASKSQPTLLTGIAVVLLAVVISVLTGFGGALFGWFGQVFLISVLIPLALLVVNYKFAFFALVLLMPFAGAQFIPKVGPLSIVNLLLIGVLAMLLLRLALRKIVGKKVILPVPKQFVLYFVIPITVGFLVGSDHLREIPSHQFEGDARNTTLSYYWISTYLKSMLFSICAIALGAVVVEFNSARAVIVSALVSAVLYVIATSVIFLISPQSLEIAVGSRQMFSATGRHANGVGAMLLPMLGAALFMREAARSTMGRLAIGAAALILFSGILLTGSRGAFLGMITVIGFYVLTSRKFRSLVVVLIVGAAAMMLVPDAITDRLTMGIERAGQTGSDLTSEDERLTSGRIHLAQQLLPEVLKSPLIGRGMGSTRWSDYAKNGGQIGHPHNLYLTTLLDIGVLGLACMIMFVRFLARSLRRLARDHSLQPLVRAYFAGSLAGLFGYLVFGMSGGYPYPQIEQWFIWVSFGVAMGCHVLQTRTKNPEDQRTDRPDEALPFKRAFWTIRT